MRLHGIRHGADTGHHRATEDSCFVERQIGIDLDQRLPRHDAYSAKAETPR